MVNTAPWQELSEAFDIATSGYIFVVSETLYGLSAVPLPRPR